MSGYITVLLQKSNPEGDWGFKMGPIEPKASVVITQIDQSCVAAELLEPGDRIIEIEGMETSKLTVEELQSLLGNPSKRLSMVVLKKNLPKGDCTIKKTTRQETATVEETREETQRKKEYEVLLEVGPSENIEELMKSIKGKIERGEKLDAKELHITSSMNKNLQQSTSSFDSTKETFQRDFGSQQTTQFNQPRHSEIIKRKEKLLKEQKKEEFVHCEKMHQEKLSIEAERKKKPDSFWTEPPSDLKNVIRNNQHWQKKDSDEPITTSKIFSHLNDLHNTLRKGSARDEKRQFWENCRKKYGWDPPGSKYNVSHRPDPGSRTEDLRSRSCEPEHLDSQNPFRRETYRQTNPFYSPTPTNPFISDKTKSLSEEQLRGSTEEVKVPPKVPPRNNLASEEALNRLKNEKISKMSILDNKTSELSEHQVSSEAHREDFHTKCEFFEKATSVPTTSCVKNAQDIVSERLGANQRSTPSTKTSEQLASNTSSVSETLEEHNVESQNVIEESQMSDRNLSEHKAFLGQNVLRQSATGSMTTSNDFQNIHDFLAQSEKKISSSQKMTSENISREKLDLKKQDFMIHEQAEKMASENLLRHEIQSIEKNKDEDKNVEIKPARKLSRVNSMEDELKNHPLVIAALQKEREYEANISCEGFIQEKCAIDASEKLRTAESLFSQKMDETLVKMDAEKVQEVYKLSGGAVQAKSAGSHFYEKSDKTALKIEAEREQGAYKHDERSAVQAISVGSHFSEKSDKKSRKIEAERMQEAYKHNERAAVQVFSAGSHFSERSDKTSLKIDAERAVEGYKHDERTATQTISAGSHFSGKIDGKAQKMVAEIECKANKFAEGVPHAKCASEKFKIAESNFPRQIEETAQKMVAEIECEANKFAEGVAHAKGASEKFKTAESHFSRQIEETAQQQMKQSYDKIQQESKTLYSLGNVSKRPNTVDFGEPMSKCIIPDSTAFPGMSLDFQKRSLVETSYEKVVRSGTPYENVESAWTREFRLATPGGGGGSLEGCGQEEIFRQEAIQEGLRTSAQYHQSAVAAEAIDASYVEFVRHEGSEPNYEYSCGYKREGVRSGHIQGGNGSMIQAASK